MLRFRTEKGVASRRLHIKQQQFVLFTKTQWRPRRERHVASPVNRLQIFYCFIDLSKSPMFLKKTIENFRPFYNTIFISCNCFSL